MTSGRLDSGEARAMTQTGVARMGPVWLMTYLVEACSNSGVRELMGLSLDKQPSLKQCAYRDLP